uniref:Serotype a capsulation locus region II DNA n=1 Tax=Haemophilus influenzae TaxID=727 RepID=Q48157_HAEIF|nr:unnamed protein product [Haemophilus influenzae]
MRNIKTLLELIKNEDKNFSFYKSFYNKSIYYDFPFFHHKENKWDNFTVSIDLVKQRFYFYLRSHLKSKSYRLFSYMNGKYYCYHIAKLTDLDVSGYIFTYKMIENLSIYNTPNIELEK